LKTNAVFQTSSSIFPSITGAASNFGTAKGRDFSGGRLNFSVLTAIGTSSLPVFFADFLSLFFGLSSGFFSVAEMLELAELLVKRSAPPKN
jgi:hypothetical protein